MINPLKQPVRTRASTCSKVDAVLPMQVGTTY